MADITLIHYSLLYNLSLADAAQHAHDRGFTLNTHADPFRLNRGNITVQAAIEAAEADPSLVYLSGRCEQTGATADDLHEIQTDGGYHPPAVVEYTAANGHTARLTVVKPRKGRWGLFHRPGRDVSSLDNPRDAHTLWRLWDCYKRSNGAPAVPMSPAVPLAVALYNAENAAQEVN